MGVITVTAANVRPCDGYPLHTRRANTGATVTPGQAIYIASDGDAEPADGDDASQAQAVGIALSNGNGGTSFAAGERIDYVTHGPVSGFSGMTPGAAVYVSQTAGALDHTPSATAGDYNYIVGYAESETVLFVQPSLVIPAAVTG